MVTSVLARLTGEPESFKKGPWTRFPVHHESTGGFDDLVCFDDVVDVLASGVVRPPYLRLEQAAGPPVLPALFTGIRKAGRHTVRDFVEGERLIGHVMSGATAVIHEFQLFSKPVRRLCESLEEELGEKFTAAVFLTPPGERGLATHYDNMDVFVVQIEGRKRWVVHEKTGPTPDRAAVLHSSATGPVALETMLNPGECLYVPAGAAHAATAEDTLSVHLSLGGKPVLWRELLMDAVRLHLDDDAFAGALDLVACSDEEIARKFLALAGRLGGLLARRSTNDHHEAIGRLLGTAAGGEPVHDRLSAFKALNAARWQGLRVVPRAGTSVTEITGLAEHLPALPERMVQAVLTEGMRLEDAATMWGRDEVRRLAGLLLRTGTVELVDDTSAGPRTNEVST